MSYTRRDATKLALSTAALAAVPVVLQAEELWGERLERGLNALIEDGTFKVTRLAQSGVRTSATLTLTWPPGLRSRRVEAEGGYEALEVEAVQAFADLLSKRTI